MKELHFKKTPGGTYQILFYIGDFFVPVEDGLVKELKKYSNTSQEEFLKIIMEKMGYNTYLKSAIQEVLKGSNDPATLAKTLLIEIQSL